ncbi:similarity to KINESIN-LIKE PROTEIN A [Encephalitozoon cuniculi GB-M1]|uniref:Similarity to KINESIN-LIKE PROTEIN A n=1 Tax=Encephalitozoon cuniculi (strain GB-M1) TaxID=284813 RepID=Q8SUH1_ENCCU|nr:uncharacterized protein ECU10_0320 [Encephalitozoon cuniculi GB-M1]CAD25751.1 similarity to KINESIN-LIKE PROTEIN A [Encephalitozoon cuniculi GB-M1]
MSSGTQHRIDEIKEVFSEIKENIGERSSNKIRKNSVLLEVCVPGTCGYDGCSKSARNRESELLERIKELESVIAKSSRVTYDDGGCSNTENIKIAVDEKNTEIQRIREELARIMSVNDDLRKDNAEMQSHLYKYKEKAERLEEVEKEYLKYKEAVSKLKGEIMDLKGSIRMICRIRPNMPGGTGSRMEISDESLRIETNGKEYVFSFDRVFGPDATQRCIYGEVEMTLHSVLEGYRVCVFAYGQTGSGKTYTMEGIGDDPGLIIQAVRGIYRTVGEMEAAGWCFDNTCNYVEIYNEEIIDLLSEDMRKVAIVHKGTDASIMDCSSIPIHDISGAISSFQDGARKKRVGDTSCNSKSSRSHAVYILNVRMRNETLKQQREGAMVLIDLAGSERLNASKAEGIRLKETQNINRSLSALGDVFNSILRKDSHIPFRNSKLTHLLQSFLSGNSRTIMLVNISPAADHFNETLCSLRFADKVGRCKLGSIRRKVTSTISE